MQAPPFLCWACGEEVKRRDLVTVYLKGPRPLFEFFHVGCSPWKGRGMGTPRGYEFEACYRASRARGVFQPEAFTEYYGENAFAENDDLVDSDGPDHEMMLGRVNVDEDRRERRYYVPWLFNHPLLRDYLLGHWPNVQTDERQKWEAYFFLNVVRDFHHRGIPIHLSEWGREAKRAQRLLDRLRETKIGNCAACGQPFVVLRRHTTCTACRLDPATVGHCDAEIARRLGVSRSTILRRKRRATESGVTPPLIGKEKGE